ncbi:hypothetical protein [Streptomyces sp. SAJ15]|uniref:hypothetical protein n=1 Tax=Streptomyces sp. SAJ15 TaxID=2011095 RepID=UPI001186A9A8|nr:hypothetical protein [Streptomyces sp. SAJ15]
MSDRELAGFLADEALLEIRHLARRARMSPEEAAHAEVIDKMDKLADFCRDMRAIAAGPRPWRPSQRGIGYPSRRTQAMRARPMSYRWNVANEERQAWILSRIDAAGYRWTPPPALPTPRKGVPPLTLRQHLGLLFGWPVKTPHGCRPLPRQSRSLKALDRDELFSLQQEAGRLRLGMGEASTWLHAHLDPDATHYLFPDPPSFYWPNPDAGRRWWHCRVLVRMIDGEWVNSSLSVLPETFAALPSTVPRLRQRHLVATARLTERDVGLWGRDHEPCTPEGCGYTPPDEHQGDDGCAVSPQRPRSPASESRPPHS